MTYQPMRARSTGTRTAVLVLVVTVWTHAAAQVQSPPPIVDHYARATLLVAPVATPAIPPVGVTSEAEYLSVYGQQPPGAADPGRTAARLFFDHGGELLYVASPPTPDAAGFRGALADSCALDVDLVVAAGVDCCTDNATDHASLMRELAAHASGTRQRFALLGPPKGSDAASLLAFRASLGDTQAAALHAPWLVVPDPATSSASITVPASAAVAGIVTRTDTSEGMHVSPAGERAEIFADALESDLSADGDALNVESVNVIREFSNPTRLLVWGARTMTTSTEFRFIAPTRLYRHLKHSLTESLHWIRDEDAADVDAVAIENRLEAWLFGYFQAGSFQGATANEAYFHSCTSEALSLRCTVGIAPIRPAEFMIFVVEVPFREVLFQSNFDNQDCG